MGKANLCQNICSLTFEQKKKAIMHKINASEENLLTPSAHFGDSLAPSVKLQDPFPKLGQHASRRPFHLLEK